MSFLRRTRRFWIAGLLLAGLVAAVAADLRKSPEQAETIRVSKRDLTQEALIAGRVQARKTATLGFESMGTATRVAVEVGQRVAKGDLLIALDTRGLAAELARASATKAAALFDARLALTRAEQDLRDIQAKQAATLERARQTVRNTKAEFDQSEDVRQQVIAERGDQSSEARSALLTVRRAESAYRTAQGALREAQALAAQAEHMAQAALDQARADLTEVTQAAPDTPGLSALDAEVALAHFRLRKAELLSPIAGTVTAVNSTEGELVAAGTPVVTVETIDEVEIVADVPEIDIAKLVIGQKASVTFDAVKDMVALRATISRIHPSAVLIEGVPTYRMTLTIGERDERIRPGMTADIRVETGARAGVLALPSRALTTRDGRTSATVRLPDGRTEEREVSTGLRSTDGFVEITRGLADGGEVLLPVERRSRAP
ncbi:MAG: HlyD family secretion protein [Parcubacteria group bacterium Gr01-1014_38]|nr:MAG: HlyD family secretion protein [Parcubacteria group bacterium Gr01-1014_38]